MEKMPKKKMNRAQRAKTIAGALGAGRSGRKAVGKAVKVGQAVRKGNKNKAVRAGAGLVKNLGQTKMGREQTRKFFG